MKQFSEQKTQASSPFPDMTMKDFESSSPSGKLTLTYSNYEAIMKLGEELTDTLLTQDPIEISEVANQVQLYFTDRIKQDKFWSTSQCKSLVLMKLI